VRHLTILVSISILFGLFLPCFSLAQIETPETVEDVQKLGEKALEVGQQELPGLIERIWQEEVLPIWQKMYEIWLKWWRNTIEPWLDGLWQKVRGLLGQEIEKRKPLIEEEFEKEKKEMKEELKTEGVKAGQSLWQKFKELIK